ncbi:hypothetical protein KUM39_13935 [Streptomyces sp. J2-1]|uniref:hypothetical protein n=1 Tax=Streptomyces corallincola TaxID=2851888 RepID=UPI001C3860EA|nr:hypothetical protein [Streptomyces corallincola]MBV2355455.1 hypothetical protein [Streptomyces corallincola]
MLRRTLLPAAVALIGLLAPAASAAPAMTDAAAPAAPGKLTNLAHLDALTTSVKPPAQTGHTTYRLAEDPSLRMLWVYANALPGGGYQPTGGGDFDAAHNTYGQGAYDADDIARAAVVYLRHWRADGDTHSRAQAYGLLRGLTYLQTASGKDAGNVVLWMQPDGTLNRTPTPPDTPNPSDTGASYWLARTVWALGEGYADFKKSDPKFADFLKSRMELAVGALNRQVLGSYGTYDTADGHRVPAWLITGGADATSEAMTGLSAYVGAGGGGAARTALKEFARGVAALGGGDARQWPYGALLPTANSVSNWHAWGAHMPEGLAQAAAALHDPALLAPAVSDASVFTPHLLTSTGPDNSLAPAPVDGSQIAYGADSRVESLLAVAAATRTPGPRRLAGIAAGWFFGQNPAGTAMYDPATGVTFDGVSADGTVNHNSGAESTIHGLLSMEALDAAPDVARTALAAGHITARDGQRVVEAESARLGGGATKTTPSSAWTGESQWSGGAYVSTGPGSTLTWKIPAGDGPRLLAPVADLTDGGTGTLSFTADDRHLGTLRYGTGGPQGISPAPGALLPVTLNGELPAKSVQLKATGTHGTGALDALLIQPEVSRLVTGADGHGTALLASAATASRTVTVQLPGSGPATVTSYDATGHAHQTREVRGASVRAEVLPGGYTIAAR